MATEDGMFSPGFLSTEENSVSLVMDQNMDSIMEYKEEQKKEVLEYLMSKLRMIKLLRAKTFPPTRDLI